MIWKVIAVTVTVCWVVPIGVATWALLIRFAIDEFEKYAERRRLNQYLGGKHDA